MILEKYEDNVYLLVVVDVVELVELVVEDVVELEEVEIVDVVEVLELVAELKIIQSQNFIQITMAKTYTSLNLLLLLTL